jgi:5-methylcytosine-specific restriction endonuclease McrA
MLDNKQEAYNCFYCGKFLWPAEVTLDHYHSRSRHPELRYELSNLRPCCWNCNGEKGSTDGDDFTGGNI